MPGRVQGGRASDVVVMPPKDVSYTEVVYMCWGVDCSSLEEMVMNAGSPARKVSQEVVSRLQRNSWKTQARLASQYCLRNLGSLRSGY